MLHVLLIANRVDSRDLRYLTGLREHLQDSCPDFEALHIPTRLNLQHIRAVVERCPAE